MKSSKMRSDIPRKNPVIRKSISTFMKSLVLIMVITTSKAMHSYNFVDNNQIGTEIDDNCEHKEMWVDSKFVRYIRIGSDKGFICGWVKILSSFEENEILSLSLDKLENTQVEIFEQNEGILMRQLVILVSENVRFEVPIKKQTEYYVIINAVGSSPKAIVALQKRINETKNDDESYQDGFLISFISLLILVVCILSVEFMYNPIDNCKAICSWITRIFRRYFRSSTHREDDFYVRLED
ncbi:unnamed protein product [Moneuplotes crassus]|uniref:Uncharacterized protein n=1 Tax=Euplotes crassus TaxID=5936 RepID=A0AAD1XLY3_EUPCR|nr:unnamed protein product [Moneuplotes crassus]